MDVSRASLQLDWNSSVARKFLNTNETYFDDNATLLNVSDSDAEQLRLHFSELVDQIGIIAGWFLIIVGSVCHGLALIVLLRSKRMRLLSVTVYLVANSLAALVALYIGLLPNVIVVHFKLDANSFASDIGCSVFVTLANTSMQPFTWLQAAISIERTLAVVRPFHYKRWCTWRRNVIAVTSIAIMLVVVNAIFVIVSKLRVDEHGECQSEDDDFKDIAVYIYMTLLFVCPIATIIPCNILTLRAVFRSRTKSRSSSRGRKLIQLTIRLLVQNCVFVATTLPVFVMLLLPRQKYDDLETTFRDQVGEVAVWLMWYLGTTFGFLTYSPSARRIRRFIGDRFVNFSNANSCVAQRVIQLPKLDSGWKSLVWRTPGSRLHLSSDA